MSPKEYGGPGSDSYFDLALAGGRGEESGASLKLFRDRITFQLPASELARSGLEEIRKVNDLLGNPTTMHEEGGKYSLTTLTTDQATTALFFTRHLEDKGVLARRSTAALESELTKNSHLNGSAAGASSPEKAVPEAGMKQARAQADGLRKGDYPVSHGEGAPGVSPPRPSGGRSLG